MERGEVLLFRKNRSIDAVDNGGEVLANVASLRRHLVSILRANHPLATRAHKPLHAT